MFTFIFLLSNLLGYFISFNLILKKLQVVEQRYKRSAYLSLLLLGIQFVISTICELVQLDKFASFFLTIVVFMILIRKFLVLTTWQTVLIPIVVPIIGQLFFVVIFATSIGVFGSISVQ